MLGLLDYVTRHKVSEGEAHLHKHWFKDGGKQKSSERKRNSVGKDSMVGAGRIGTTKKSILLSRGKSARKDM